LNSSSIIEISDTLKEYLTKMTEICQINSKKVVWNK